MDTSAVETPGDELRVRCGQAPSADRAHLLARCAEILRVSQLRPEDDFFGVGGDSLDAVEVSEMLSRECGRDVGMDKVLRSRTFSEMLDAIVE